MIRLIILNQDLQYVDQVAPEKSAVWDLLRPAAISMSQTQIWSIFRSAEASDQDEQWGGVTASR